MTKTTPATKSRVKEKPKRTREPACERDSGGSSGWEQGGHLRGPAEEGRERGVEGSSYQAGRTESAKDDRERLCESA